MRRMTIQNLSVVLVALLFGSCHPNNNDYLNQQRVISNLSERLSNLETQVKELNKRPDDVLRDAAAMINSGSIKDAETLLNNSLSRFYNSDQIRNASLLYGRIETEKERIAYEHLINSFNENEYRSFAKKYPKSRYTKQLTRTRHYLQNSLRKQKAQQQRYSNAGTTRVGAICCDGTRSYATGRGACSHHGGVCQWLYE